MSSHDTTSYTVAFLNSLELSGVPSHKLELKVGVPVLLMLNLDTPRLCNGTRLRITELGWHSEGHNLNWRSQGRQCSYTTHPNRTQ
ncbi:ATP-dependent DNA helicase [Trichonephila clavipes]|nr:ATP-dependent DNA helicase [Trichonephila clavipes]